MSDIETPAWFKAEVARAGNDVLAGRTTRQQATARLTELIIVTGGEFLTTVLAH